MLLGILAFTSTASLLAQDGEYDASNESSSQQTLINRVPASIDDLSNLTINLVQSKLYNASSYFFIKSLQSNDPQTIRRVLKYLPQLMQAVGGDLLRTYVLRHTKEENYDTTVRDYFFYFLGKDFLIKDNPTQALAVLTKISQSSQLSASAAYLRGTAYAILGQTSEAIQEFKRCQYSDQDDLSYRCLASLARTYYQIGNFDEADEIYDEIPKSSFVWTDILFEQAWNAYAKGYYNRSLGKLVTYYSPSIQFVFNPEIEVLQAQSYLALCLYDDVNKVVNQFYERYTDVGSKMKDFLVSNDQDLFAFWSIAKQAYAAKLHIQTGFYKALNRFIRGPYFADLIAQERAVARERQRVQANKQKLGGHEFTDFLLKILSWRQKSIQLLGGLFVKNSLLDLYQDFLSNLDKMSFIKLDMLKRAKTKLEKQKAQSEDEDGVMKRGRSSVDRKDYQYFWTFNGEFWADELGDYVFALDSECGS